MFLGQKVDSWCGSQKKKEVRQEAATGRWHQPHRAATCPQGGWGECPGPQKNHIAGEGVQLQSGPQKRPLMIEAALVGSEGGSCRNPWATSLQGHAPPGSLMGAWLPLSTNWDREDRGPGVSAS